MALPRWGRWPSKARSERALAGASPADPYIIGIPPDVLHQGGFLCVLGFVFLAEATMMASIGYLVAASRFHKGSIQDSLSPADADAAQTAHGYTGL